MDVDEMVATTEAMGPVQARALRRSNLADDGDDPGIDDLVEEPGSVEGAGSAEVTTVTPPTDRNDLAREAASAADHAARLSRFTALPDGIVDQLRDAAATAVELEPEPSKARRRWGRGRAG